jgi:hypothetical protein
MFQIIIICLVFALLQMAFSLMAGDLNKRPPAEAAPRASTQQPRPSQDQQARAST